MVRSSCLSYVDWWLPRSQRVLCAREQADEDTFRAVPGHRAARPRRLRKQVCHPVFTSPPVAKSYTSSEQNVSSGQTAFISSHVVTQFCTTADCRVLALFFFCRVSWYRLCCRKVSCRHPTPRLQMIFLHLFSIYHLSFLSGCQTCRSP